MSCSSDPPQHAFAEHTNSGKIFCRKCALFLGDVKEVTGALAVENAKDPTGINNETMAESTTSNVVPSDEFGTTTTSTTTTTTSDAAPRPTCLSENHNYYQHTKSHRLYCTKCGKFEGMAADIQSTSLAAVTTIVQKGADSAKKGISAITSSADSAAKKGIQSIKGKFRKSSSADDVPSNASES